METLDPNLLALRIHIHYSLAKYRLLLQFKIHGRSKRTSIYQRGQSPLSSVVRPTNKYSRGQEQMTDGQTWFQSKLGAMASALFFLISWALSTGLQPHMTTYVFVAYLAIGGVSYLKLTLRPNSQSAIYNPTPPSNRIQLPPPVQSNLATHPSRRFMGPSRRSNHRSLPLSFLRNKQYMRNQEFLEYARIRIRSTSTGITSNEAK
jgi:hypothetical protein